ncbi:MAG: hypothetical protein EZS28_013385 [Streblomastix strix]|uniref:KilA-N domain-containing protein n=1 Tax=Streblomastix strix TaxID=222440 RepID=A0A5J4W9P5_9EUKA|nr:MAG: hypothetical protein EZS28_013385 [Streblomastix strix]
MEDLAYTIQFIHLISFVDPMANESDEDTRLELMDKYDAEVDDIFKDIQKMTSETPTTRQIGSNNENFTISSYNGFEIMIRDSDGFINSTKLVQQINEREQTRKYLTNITCSPVFVEYKQYLEQSGLFNLMGHLCYLLPTAFMNDVRGTYVHKQLLNIICIKSSVKYLHHVATIMDKINEITIAEHEADKIQTVTNQFHNVINVVTDTLSNRITELNYGKQSLIPRTVPKATTINEVIKEQLSNRQGMKIKATKYTFPFDQLDDIIERIKQIVIEDEQLEEQQEDHITI